MPNARGPDRGAESPADSAAGSELDRVDAELRNLLRSDSLPGLYAGPWWPFEPEPGTPDPPTGFKCAVLRRRPEGGAEHLGHLFLLRAAPPVDLGRRAMVGPDTVPVRVPQWTLPSAHGPLLLLARARPDAGGERPLERLAAELAARLRSGDRGEIAMTRPPGADVI